MTGLHLRPQAQARVPGSWTTVNVGVLGSAAVAGSLAGIAEHLVLPVLAVPVVVAVALRPQFGAYLYLIFAPLIAGMPRSVVAPFIRPSEGLLILILAAWFTRIFLDSLRGKLPRLAFDRVELALALLAFTASVPPLLLRFGRNLPISTDDVLYALVLWKFLLVYCLFRRAVTTAGQVQICLWLAMASSTIVALVAIMQVLDLFGVPELLWVYYDRPFEGISGLVTHRGDIDRGLILRHGRHDGDELGHRSGLAARRPRTAKSGPWRDSGCLRSRLYHFRSVFCRHRAWCGRPDDRRRDRKGIETDIGLDPCCVGRPGVLLASDRDTAKRLPKPGRSSGELGRTA